MGVLAVWVAWQSTMLDVVDLWELGPRVVVLGGWDLFLGIYVAI